MTNRIRACLPGLTLQTALFCGLAAATMIGTLATTAHADEHYDRDGQWNASRSREQAHQQAVQQARWHEQHRYDQRYRQSDVYYSAPPVVYQPPVYYQQPGASLNLNFPFLTH